MWPRKDGIGAMAKDISLYRAYCTVSCKGFRTEYHMKRYVEPNGLPRPRDGSAVQRVALRGESGIRVIERPLVRPRLHVR